MKKIVLAVFLSAFSLSAFAQKSLSIAQKAFTKGNFAEASKLIDVALKDPKVSKKPKAFLIKGNIYDSLATTTDDVSKAKEYIKEAVKNYNKFAEMKGGAEKAFAGVNFGNDVMQIAQRGGVRSTPQLTLGQNFAYKAFKAYEAEDFKKAQEQFYLAGLSNNKDTSSYENAIRMVYQTDPVDYNLVKEISGSMVENGLKTEFAYQALLEATENVDKDNAGQVLADARKQFPDAQLFMLKEINHYISEGKTDEAIKNLEKAAEQDPNNHSLFLNLGLLYEQTKNSELAVKNYEKAYELKSDDYNAAYSLGAFHFNEGVKTKNEGSKLDLEEYKTKGKEFEAKAEGSFKKALPYFEKALSLKKDDEQLLNALFSIYSQLKQTDKASAIKALIDKL